MWELAGDTRPESPAQNKKHNAARAGQPQRRVAPPPARPQNAKPAAPQKAAQPQQDLWDLAGEEVTQSEAEKQAAKPQAAQKQVYRRGTPVDETKKERTTPKEKQEKQSLTGENAVAAKNAQNPQLTANGINESNEIVAEDKPKRESAQYKRKRKREKEPLPKKTVAKRVALVVCAVLLAGIIGGGAFFLHATRNDDLWLDLHTIPYKNQTQLLYTDQVTGEVGVYARIPCTQNKEYLDPALMPQQLKDAFVAIEDQKFYTHHGVDPKRTLFAIVNEGWHAVTGKYLGGRKQGASTIDQQLIKNLTRDDEDSNMAGYLRKLREMCRALKLDAQYSKDEILGAYLNVISFTGNTAGVEAEAQKLFGKSAQYLNLQECASLAAITRNPYRFNPAVNPEDHIERRNYVLYEMHEQGYITQAEYDEAAASPLIITGNKEPELPKYVTGYFTDTVIDAAITELVNQRGISRREASNLIYNGGLRIYTTVQPQLQTSMEQVMVSGTYHPRPKVTVYGQLKDEDGKPLTDESGGPVMGNVQVTPQAAMVSLDYDGGICAIVGGLGEKEISRGFNRATSAVRQVGSTMKPIGPYVTALESGYIHWSSSFYDDAVAMVKDPATGEESPWPANVTRQYTEKDILVKDALAHSVNTIAVRVGQTVGNREMYTFVHGDLGINTFVRKDAAPGPLTLGSSTYGITPLDMAKAYAMFGNGGYMVTPHCFTEIESGTGESLIKVNAPKNRVISEDTSYIMNRLLRTVVTQGTAAGLSVPGEMDSVGKTGTTSDKRDHWFIGLTPYYVTASWYGYDENVRLEASGGNNPTTLAWRAVMQQGQQGLPYKDFPEGGAVQKDYCTVSGYAAGAACPSEQGWYHRWNTPQKGCPVH